MSDLRSIYSAATLYIQPSLYEGFGLPVLEAMQSGTPVACSKNSSLTEIGGQAVYYFNPQNPETIINTINHIINLNQSQRKQIINDGIQHSKKFSWEKTAQETIKVYQKCMS